MFEKLETRSMISHPFNMVVAGPSQSGKTWWVMRLLSNPQMIEPRIEKIIYHYSEWQPTYEKMNNVEFVKGLPGDLPDGKQRTLLILDDLMTESSNNPEITLLFTRGTHHRNCSVVLIAQNFFEKGLRTITLNSHYLVLMKNRRAISQIRALSSQLYEKKSKFLVEAFEDASLASHGYLFIDLKQNTEENLRVRSNIFSESGWPPIVYTL